MDNKIFLVKAITLRFREMELGDLTINSSDIINEALKFVKTPERTIVSEFNKDPVISLRESLVGLLKRDMANPIDKTELLQTLRINCGNDVFLYQSLADGINAEVSKETATMVIKSLRDSIRSFITETSIMEMSKTFYMKTHFDNQDISWRDYVRDLMTALEPFTSIQQGNEKHPSIVDEIDMHNDDDLRDVINRGLNELDISGIIRFGLQGFNELFGDHYGGRRGEMIAVEALQHQYKSGTTKDMFRAAAIYNKPYMLDAKKKPLLLRVSFETTAKQDIMDIYKVLKEQETGIAVDLHTVDTEEAKTYFQQRMGAMGYHVKVVHVDPSEFTVYDLFDLVIKYESEGYEVHMLNLDYLNMISKKGLVHGPHGVEVRDAFRRVRNFIAARSILTITPHQLSTQAKELIREGLQDEFVKLLPGKGYTDSCKTIDQELDMEIFQHTVIKNGIKYITWQRGKHRKVGETPEEYRYVVYPFSPVGNILDDINTDSKALRKLPSSNTSDTWEF